MALLAHRRTWHFSVAAPADQCFQAFHRAMARTDLRVGGIKWLVEQSSVSHDSDPEQRPWAARVATFDGRRGVMSALSAFSEYTQAADRAMVGTQLTFAVDPASPAGRAECAMWLSKSLSVFTMPIRDMLFIRGYMQGVERQLRQLDTGLRV